MPHPSIGLASAECPHIPNGGILELFSLQAQSNYVRRSLPSNNLVHPKAPGEIAWMPQPQQGADKVHLSHAHGHYSIWLSRIPPLECTEQLGSTWLARILVDCVKIQARVPCLSHELALPTKSGSMMLIP